MTMERDGGVLLDLSGGVGLGSMWIGSNSKATSLNCDPIGKRMVYPITVPIIARSPTICYGE